MTSRRAGAIRIGLAAAILALGGCAELHEEAELRDLEQASSIHFSGEPGAGVEFFNYGTQSNMAEPGSSPVLADIVNHLPASYGRTYFDSDPITWGHETSHGIHAHLRNNFNNTGQRANAFYLLNNRAALVQEPDIRKSTVAPFVPASLRGSRFDLYITGSADWDDTPLYVWDEWNAYINGGEVGVDMVERGLWDRGWRDGVAGQLEFTVYALALAMAVAEQDPDYFARNVAFKELLAFNTRRAMAVYRKGALMSDFTWDTQDRYLRAFEESPDAEPLRAFARDLFGQQWADHVLFDGPPPSSDPDPEPNPDAPQPEADEPDSPAPDPDPGADPGPDPSAGWTDDGLGGGWADDPNAGQGFVDTPPPASPTGCQTSPGQRPHLPLWLALPGLALLAVTRKRL